MPSIITGCLWLGGQMDTVPEMAAPRPGSMHRMGGGERVDRILLNLAPPSKAYLPSQVGFFVYGESLPNAEPLCGSDWASRTAPVFQTDMAACEGAQGTGCWALLLKSSMHLTGKLRAP